MASDWTDLREAVHASPWTPDFLEPGGLDCVACVSRSDVEEMVVYSRTGAAAPDVRHVI